MNIYYITNSKIPSTKAHSNQIITMCVAFLNSDNNIEIWLPRRIKLLIGDLNYGYSGYNRPE